MSNKEFLEAYYPDASLRGISLVSFWPDGLKTVPITGLYFASPESRFPVFDLSFGEVKAETPRQALRNSLD